MNAYSGFGAASIYTEPSLGSRLQPALQLQGEKND
jgi:hypothetical protein